MSQDFFISGDWGTSNLRLQVVKTKKLEVLFKAHIATGVKALHSQYLNQEILSQKDFFISFLRNQLREFPSKFQHGTIVMSGMASSSIGIEELPYANIPFDATGNTISWKKIAVNKLQDIVLISGVMSELNVMRGEEMQALGIADYMNPSDQGILILPGTHSKHLEYDSGIFKAFKTYMTGELFSILSEHSILSRSIEKCDFGQSRINSFEEGLDIGLAGKLSSELFSIRVRDLLYVNQCKNNYYLLSGMLIGDELSYLRNEKGQVFMAASQPIHTLYRLALERIIDSEKLTIFDDNIIEKALLLGQRKILMQDGL